MVPVIAEALVHLEIFVVHLVRRAFDLDVAPGPEIDVLALGQFQHQFLDEGRDVVVGPHLAAPLLDAEDFFGHLDLHVLLDVDLAGQTIALLGLSLGDV